MANVYVYSGAAGAGTGADWTNAYTTLAAACAAKAAGDDFWVAHDHAETQASAITITAPGTSASPNRIVCASRSGSTPPVSADLRTTATVTTTGNNGMTVNGCFYCYGVQFVVSSGGTTFVQASFNNAAGSNQVYEACGLKLPNTGSTSRFNFGSSSSNAGEAIKLVNTVLTFGNAGQYLNITKPFAWLNTASAVAGTTPTQLFKSNSQQPAPVILDGVDLSALGSGATLVSAVDTGQPIVFINCRTGASSAVASAGAALGSANVDFLDSDSGSLNYRQERYNFKGTLTAETVIVVGSGGASDGTTPISWKVATTANAKRTFPFESFPYTEWCDTTGGALTRTFELVNDGTTLTNAEVWAEVEYLGSSSYPLASTGSTGPADPLAAGTNLTTSTATWTTTGLASPVKQKIAVTFTPQMKGYFRIVFKFARASKTVYLNPRPNEI